MEGEGFICGARSASYIREAAWESGLPQTHVLLQSTPSKPTALNYIYLQVFTHILFLACLLLCSQFGSRKLSLLQGAFQNCSEQFPGPLIIHPGRIGAVLGMGVQG